MQQRGKFIVFEGVDFSGKTTIAELFAQELQQELGDDAVLLTHEPYEEAAAGLFIREVLAKKFMIHPWAFALAFSLNRADHCARLIVPALDMGKTVVCDRYLWSSLVYQVSDGISEDSVRLLNQKAIKPDLTFLLEVSAETRCQRQIARKGEAELFDARLGEMQRRYSQIAAFEIFRGSAVGTIDANGTTEDVLTQCLEVWYSFGQKTHD